MKEIMSDLKFRTLSPRENATMSYHDFDDYSDVDQLGFTPGYDEVMQYTGLKDKNGVEIYEGDIIGGRRNKNYVDVVKFGTATIIDNEMYSDNKVSGFYLQPYEFGEEGHISHLNDIEKREVIGNIYENKDLLNNNN